MINQNQSFSSNSSNLKLSKISSTSSTRKNKMPQDVRLQVIHNSNQINQHSPMQFHSIYWMLEAITNQQPCQLCLYNYAPQQLKQICNCEHKFCQSCLNQYLIYKINASQEIICPSEDCQSPINKQSSLFQSLSQMQRQKYHKQQLWRQTMKNPNAKICPLQQCKEGVVNLLLDPPQCNSCKTTYCPQCMMKMHKGPCDKNFECQFKQWRRCPNCRLFINKDGGCNHIVCQCGEQFCFVCLERWEDYHYQCIDIHEIRGPFGACINRSPFISMVAFGFLFPFVLLMVVIGGVLSMSVMVVVGTFLAPIIILKQFQQYLTVVLIVLPIIMSVGGVCLSVYFLVKWYMPFAYRCLSIYSGIIRSLWTQF